MFNDIADIFVFIFIMQINFNVRFLDPALSRLPLPPTEDHFGSTFVPLNFDKTADEVSFITRTLLGNSVCQGVPDLPSMVSAFESVQE